MNVRLGMALLLVPMIAACTNLSAIQKYAATSSAIAQSEPVIAGWPSTYQQVTSLAGTSAVRRRYPDAVMSFQQRTQKIQAEIPLALQSAQMLSLYMQALGALAGGSVTDVSKQSSSIAASIKTGSSSPDLVLATDAIDALLRAWQNYSLERIVTDANRPVQTISGYLSAVCEEIRLSDNEAMLATNTYWTAIGTDSRSEYVQVFALRAMQEDDTAYQIKIDQANAAKAAFARIGQDHAGLASHSPDLKAAQAELQSDLPLLQDALKVFAK